MVPSTFHCKDLLSLLLKLHFLACVLAGSGGYNYFKPTGNSLLLGTDSNHNFPSVSTAKPLPPLPPLPALPTPRAQSKILTQSLVQTHPTPSTYSSYGSHSGSSSYGSSYSGGSSSSYKSPTSFGTSSSSSSSSSSLFSGLKPTYGSVSSYGSGSSYKSSSSPYSGSSYSSYRSTNKPNTFTGYSYKPASSSSPSTYSSNGRYSTSSTSLPTTKGYERYGSKYKGFSTFSTIPTAPSTYGQRTGSYSYGSYGSYGSNRFGSSLSASLTSTSPQTFGHNKPETTATTTTTTVASSYGSPSTRSTYKPFFTPSPQTILSVEQPTVLLSSTAPAHVNVETLVTGPSPSVPVVVQPTLLQPVRQLNSQSSPLPTVSSSIQPTLQSQPFPSHVPTLTVPQAIHLPYGKTTVITIPHDDENLKINEDIYELNGRQLKQYAVVEIIDNDIEPSPGPKPFFNAPFFDDYRARLGASGTGAYGSSRITTANAFQQQRNLYRTNVPTDAIALGSGGLGFIRSSNGNVYLGSGSLGYISSQQHSQSLTEARTRSGAPRPDPLHFGHGPLGGNPITIRIK